MTRLTSRGSLPVLSSGGLMLLTVAGCATYRFEATSVTARTALDNDCPIALLTIPPQPPYEELGIIHRNVDAALSSEAFVERVRADVCHAGGNAVLARIEGPGVYAGGTVLWIPALDNLE